MIWRTQYVGGQEWSIYKVSKRSKFLRLNGQRKSAVCQYDQCKIYICRDLDPQSFEDTLLHELFHAAIYVSGGTTALESYCIDSDHAAKAEEQVVSGITPIFHRILKDLGFQFPS